MDEGSFTVGYRSYYPKLTYGTYRGPKARLIGMPTRRNIYSLESLPYHYSLFGGKFDTGITLER